MHRIWATKNDDFAVTVDGGLVIFATVVTEVTLHQPCLGIVWIDVQDTIDKDLGDFPSFFGDCTCRVRPVDTNLRILVTVV